MSILKRAVTSKVTRLGLAAGVVAAAALTAMPAQAAVSITLSPATGGSTAGQVVAITGTGFKTATGTNVIAATASVYFDTATTCTARASKGSGTSTAATTYSVVSATRIVATAPSLTAGTLAAPKAYLVCVYDSSAVYASATYKVYPAATIAASNAISPTKGSAVGGNTITVSGTNFTNKTTATLGGNALTGLKVATDGKSFTAVAPAHAASATAVDLTVTTEAGKVTANGTSLYTYTNAITVSPTTAPKGVTTTLTVKGLGFSALTAWSTNTSSTTASNTASKAYVYLVKGTYDNTDNSGSKTLGQTHECVNVQVVSDTELTCDLTGAAAALTDGSYVVTIVDDGSVAGTLTYQTAVSSTAVFTVADF